MTTDTQDLQKRLRDIASKGVSMWGDLQMEDAKEIEILQAERDNLASANARLTAELGDLPEAQADMLHTIKELKARLAQAGASPARNNQFMTPGCGAGGLGAKEGAPTVKPFQQRVLPWLHACFGDVIAADKVERNHRFLEESLELVQACGCTQSEAHQLVDYVFGRPVGEIPQEIGGVMVTLAALCLAQQVDMHACGEAELTRIWTKVEAIRAKQAAKPKHSPLPQAAQPSQAGLSDTQLLNWMQSKGGQWVCRDSTTGRGWRLYQSMYTGSLSVREAIIAALNAKGGV